MLELTPRESPADWAALSSPVFEFPNLKRESQRAKCTRDRRLYPVNNQWSLTDEEWNVIKVIVYARRNPRRPGNVPLYPREYINEIVTKMGSGRAWTEVSSSQSRISESFQHKLQKDGRWEKIVEFLATSRRPVGIDGSSNESE